MRGNRVRHIPVAHLGSHSCRSSLPADWRATPGFLRLTQGEPQLLMTSIGVPAGIIESWARSASCSRMQPGEMAAPVVPMSESSYEVIGPRMAMMASTRCVNWQASSPGSAGSRLGGTSLASRYQTARCAVSVISLCEAASLFAETSHERRMKSSPTLVAR